MIYDHDLIHRVIVFVYVNVVCNNSFVYRINRLYGRVAAYQLAGMGALPIDYTSIGAFNIYPVSKDIEVRLPIQIACCCPLISSSLTVIGLAASSSFDSEPVPSGFAP